MVLAFDYPRGHQLDRFNGGAQCLKPARRFKGLSGGQPPRLLGGGSWRTRSYSGSAPIPNGCSRSAKITAAQRDALYDQILDRLSGIGDIEVAIQSENYSTAERIGREYSDDLRLLLDDLGIGEGKGEPIEVATDPEVLRRTLPRLQHLAESHTASLESDRAEADRLEERNRLVSEACGAVLGSIESQ